jgi:hypothetical protein
VNQSIYLVVFLLVACRKIFQYSLLLFHLRFFIFLDISFLCIFMLASIFFFYFFSSLHEKPRKWNDSLKLYFFLNNLNIKTIHDLETQLDNLDKENITQPEIDSCVTLYINSSKEIKSLLWEIFRFKRKSVWFQIRIFHGRQCFCFTFFLQTNKIKKDKACCCICWFWKKFLIRYGVMPYGLIY